MLSATLLPELLKCVFLLSSLGSKSPGTIGRILPEVEDPMASSLLPHLALLWEDGQIIQPLRASIYSPVT